jgi:hypothetical protein
MDADYAELEKELVAYEAKIAPDVAEQAAKREAAIAAAKKSHDEHLEAIKPAMEAAEKERRKLVWRN